MADPVVAPSSALFDKVKALNQRRDARALHVAAAPLLIGAGSPTEAATIAGSWNKPQVGPISKEGALAAKLQILDKLADMQKAEADGKVDLVKALKSRGDYMKEILNTAAQVFGDRSAAYAQTLSSLNTAMVNVGNNTASFINDATKNALQGGGMGAEAGSAAVRATLDALQGGGIADPNFASAVVQNAAALQGQPAALTNYFAHLQAEANRTGQDLEPLLTSLARTGDPNAAQALELYTRVGSQVADVTKQAVDLGMASLMGTMTQLKSGALGSDEAIGFIQKLLTLPELASSSPGDAEEQLDKMLEKLKPGGEDPGARQRYEDLLTKLDDDNLPPASSLAEARRRLLASKDFQDWKAKNYPNGATDGIALKEMRRILREKNEKDKQAGLATNRARRMAGVDGDTGTPLEPETSTSKVVNLGNGGPTDKRSPEATDPQYVRDAQGEMWVLEADGSFHVFADEDWIQFDEDATNDPGGIDAIVAGPDRFDAIKAQAKPEPAKEPPVWGSEAEGAKPASSFRSAPVVPPLPEVKGPTLPMALHAAKQTLTRPAATLDSLERLARSKLFVKRKKPEDEDPLAQTTGAP